MRRGLIWAPWGVHGDQENCATLHSITEGEGVILMPGTVSPPC